MPHDSSGQRWRRWRAWPAHDARGMACLPCGTRAEDQPKAVGGNAVTAAHTKPVRSWGTGREESKL